MKKRINCAYAIPHELTGIGTICGLFNSACNKYGRRCLAYRKETKEEREYIEQKIKEAKAKNGETK